MKNSATRGHTRIIEKLKDVPQEPYRFISNRLALELERDIQALYTACIQYKTIAFSTDPHQDVSWIDCPAEVYIENWNKVVSNYQKKYGKKSSIAHCIQYEYTRLVNSKKNRLFGRNSNNYSDLISKPLLLNIEVSNEEKIVFLESKFSDLFGRRLCVRNGAVVDVPQLKKPIETNSESHESRSLNRSEYVILLTELGVYSLLESYISKNKSGTITELAKLTALLHTGETIGYDSYRKPISQIVISPLIPSAPKYDQHYIKGEKVGDSIKKALPKKYSKASAEVSSKLQKLAPEILQILSH